MTFAQNSGSNFDSYIIKEPGGLLSKAAAPDDAYEYFVNITMTGGTISGGYRTPMPAA